MGKNSCIFEVSDVFKIIGNVTTQQTIKDKGVQILERAFPEVTSLFLLHPRFYTF